MIHLFDPKWIAAMLLYGAGLRLMECLQLRVKDIDFGYRQVTVRGGKGNRDRITVLPAAVETRLRNHLEEIRQQHEEDLKNDGGYVKLPSALAGKYPGAAREWGWQWVFPSHRPYKENVTIQELLGHRDVSTTMIYTHVLNRGGRCVRSPADLFPT